MSLETPQAQDRDAADTNPLSQIPIEVLICVGRARPAVRTLLAMRPDSVLTLDSSSEDPVELYVGERLIARGELEEGEEEGSLAVRLTEVADLSEGL
ncbi:MAG: FliM/FliN family flagellar motor switch protein [Pseudomonadota bacterium]